MLHADPLPVASRIFVQWYIDSVWFCMVWHYPLVAASRLVAIAKPFWFRTVSVRQCAGALRACLWPIGAVCLLQSPA